MSAADENVIEARGITRRFGRLLAVDDVSLDVRRGSIFGLLGPNGSGKSTIIRMLCGVLDLSGGSARVLGSDVTRDAEIVKRRIGYMSQEFSLYADLTVRENLEFYGRIYGLDPDTRSRRLGEVLELTSLESRIEQLAGTLSGGWKQRLALACALIHEPELVFLDEPTAGIDPVARRELWDLLFDLSGRGVTLFVTTHSMDEAERCREVGYIYLSRLMVCGPPEDLKRLPGVTPPGTRRLGVEVRRPAAALARLRGVDGVRDATLLGQAIHILASDELSDDELTKSLDLPEEDVRVQPIAPTLEDVFVTLSRAAERGEMPQAPAPASVEVVSDADRGAGRRERMRPSILAGCGAVLTKEFAHIRRQPTTLFFLFVIPLLQLMIFGYAIDTEIENIPTVIHDLDGRTKARELAEAFKNTRTFRVLGYVQDRNEFRRALAAGEARVGLTIPPDFTEKLVGGEQVQIEALIDGSDSQVATTALNASKLLGLDLSRRLALSFGESLDRVPARDRFGRVAVPVDVRARLLYNPDLESARFFVPGLVGIILQLVTLFLTSFAIVRERELGTLEQLFVTPVGRAGLVLGKVAPYAALGFVTTLVVLNVMIYVFGVPIRGSLSLLLSLSVLFLVCGLGLGILISTLARTQLQAIQFAFIIMLPSVLLSGFMFPRSEMPGPIYAVTFAIPVTYFLEILRGIVLRGASFDELLPHVAGLTICCVAVFALSMTRFRKQIG